MTRKLNKDTSAYSNKLEYINEYQKNNYDRVNIIMQKGMKAIYKEYATEQGFNISEFFVTAANYYISTHTAQNSPEQAKKE